MAFMVTSASIRRLLERIEVPGFHFSSRLSEPKEEEEGNDGAFVRVYVVTNVESVVPEMPGVGTLGRSVKLPVEVFPDERSVLRRILYAACLLQIHEMHEQFTLDGERLFNPHRPDDFNWHHEIVMKLKESDVPMQIIDAQNPE